MGSLLVPLLLALGFREAWAIDFEFVALRGHKPFPVCMVAIDLISGRRVVLWGDELARCPFRIGDDVLLIAYYSSAESSCFDVLGWPRPRRMLDLYTEFRCLTNGLQLRHGSGLIGALIYYGLSNIGGEEKDAMRNLILRGGPWSADEMVQIIAYCASDVEAIKNLLAAMLPAITSSPKRFGQALLRGRYMVAAGIMENYGIPVDTELLNRLLRHWETIKRRLIEAVDVDFGAYVNGSFREAKFEEYLARHHIPWPRLSSGRLALDEDTFRQRAKAFPLIAPLHELRYTLGELRLGSLEVGPDGRNRVMFSAFRAKTSRNAPSTTKFIFGPATWLRHLIRPSEGRAIVYIDWSSQELAIAGALSGDSVLWEAYESGDPYLAFAKQAGLAPPDATKASHGQIRQVCKAIVLGTNYGMGAESIAAQSGIHIERARELLRLHRETYRIFWTWAEAIVDRALLGLPVETVFGWRIRYPAGSGVSVNARSMLNWPMQSHGAEMMRLAVSMGIEAGLMICAPIHDALLLEGPIDRIEEQAARLAEIMGDASELVLGPGKRCRCDIKIVRYPDRYEDERGVKMFERVMQLLEGAEAGAL